MDASIAVAGVFDRQGPDAGSIDSSVPLDGPAAELMQYLHHVHINYLLVQNNYSGTLYDSSTADKLITGEYNYNSIGRSVLRWNRTLNLVLTSSSYTKKSIGNYTLIFVK